MLLDLTLCSLFKSLGPGDPSRPWKTPVGLMRHPGRRL